MAAHTAAWRIITVYYTGSMLHAPYAIPNMKYDGYRVYTNKPPSGALAGARRGEQPCLF